MLRNSALRERELCSPTPTLQGVVELQQQHVGDDTGDPGDGWTTDHGSGEGGAWKDLCQGTVGVKTDF